METKNTISLPGIISDIDGVIVRGSKCLPCSGVAVKLLKTPLGILNSERFPNEKCTLPVVCLTNAGDVLEEDKAHIINEALGLKDSQFQFKSNEMILNYSCLRPVFDTYRGKTVLITGLGDVAKALESIGLQHYVTVDEYCLIYPHLSPSRPLRTTSPSRETVEKVTKRLEITEEQLLREPIDIHAIFIMMSPDRWEDNIQLICDIVGGSKVQDKPDVQENQQIPVYYGCVDAYLLTDHGPKISIAFFKECLELCYRKIYKKDLISEVTGKPEKYGFEYAKTLLQRQTSYPISNYYMIGDNPKTDIYGATKLGIKTILVKSGVFGGKLENDPEHPADYVVESMYDAVKLIFKLDNIANL